MPASHGKKFHTWVWFVIRKYVLSFLLRMRLHNLCHVPIKKNQLFLTQLVMPHSFIDVCPAPHQLSISEDEGSYSFSHSSRRSCAIALIFLVTSLYLIWFCCVCSITWGWHITEHVTTCNCTVSLVRHNKVLTGGIVAHSLPLLKLVLLFLNSAGHYLFITTS